VTAIYPVGTRFSALGTIRFTLVSAQGLEVSGSALWWVILSTSVNALRQRTSTLTLRWTNRLSGATIIAFGLGAFLGLVI
jgi:hypothetical protein